MKRMWVLAVMLAPAGVWAESSLPHGPLDIEGLPNRYARRAVVYHRHRAVHRVQQLRHGLMNEKKVKGNSKESSLSPWDKPAPTRFERTLVARIAQAFIDTIPAGGSRQWALRLKVILE